MNVSKKKEERVGSLSRLKIFVQNHEGFLIGFLSLLVLIIAISVTITNVPFGQIKNYVGFNFESGFYDHDIDLILTSNYGDKGNIKYNLSGDSLDKDGIIYDNPIKLIVPEEGYEVYTVKASYCNVNNWCGEPFYETYVLGKELSRDVDIDIVSITSSYENLYDYYKGILVPGVKNKEAEERGEEHSYEVGNYNERGDEWIRDAHVTMFDKTGRIMLDKNLGIAVSGWTSSALETKSLKIVGNKKHGYTQIPFDFGEGVSVYNSIKLRAGGQDLSYGNIRSSVVSRLAEESDFKGNTGTKRVVVFLNNEYYGIFDVQRSYSDSTLAKIYNLPDPDKVEKYKYSEGMAFDNGRVLDLFRADLRKEENREALEESVDLDEYFTYYALQILWNNTDWPMNNYEIWRYIDTDNESSNKYQDGKYRFLIYDADLVYYTEGNKNYFEGAIGDLFSSLMEGKNKSNGSNFANVMKATEYKTRFLAVLRELINGPFETNNVLRIIDEEAAKIDRQMQIHYSDEEYEDWKGWINLMKKAAKERNGVVRADVKKYFGVDL